MTETLAANSSFFSVQPPALLQLCDVQEIIHQGRYVAIEQKTRAHASAEITAISVQDGIRRHIAIQRPVWVTTIE